MDGDQQPIKLSDKDEDFWVAQARRANVLLDSPGFSAVIVATNGTMARMNTVYPTTFVAFKRWLAEQPDRDPLKRRRDMLQAEACRRYWRSIYRRFEELNMTLVSIFIQ